MSVTSSGPVATECQPQGPQSLPSISDFEIVKFISSGAYGDVFLAKRSAQDQQLFAVKRVAKRTLVTKNLIDQIRCERVALASTRCRHVVHLYYALQTDSHVYLVMEYLCGGDLRSMLMAVGCLPQSAAVVYTAEVAMALEYLHSHGIIHRDIKPDNMLVSASGHIKLTDFGLSQVSLDRLTHHLDNSSAATPGGYQASAEKRYPRTPRQLLSLATDFSFGSASGCGGGRGREFNPATSRPPPPPPCFDESASPLPPPALEDLDLPSPSAATGNRVRFKSASAASSANCHDDADSTDELQPQDGGGCYSIGSDDSLCEPAGGSGTRGGLRPGQLHQLQRSCQRAGQPPPQRLLGTPDYLAPELILGAAHGTPVDYWALGACLFEFLVGWPPFSADTPEEVMENILGRVIPWPEVAESRDGDGEELLSAEAVSAIDGLLRWEPGGRLALGDMRRHALFSGVPWDALHSAEAPFVPDLHGDAQDTSYFDARNRRASDRGAAGVGDPGISDDSGGHQQL